MLISLDLSPFVVALVLERLGSAHAVAPRQAVVAQHVVDGVLQTEVLGELVLVVAEKRARAGLALSFPRAGASAVRARARAATTGGANVRGVKKWVIAHLKGFSPTVPAGCCRTGCAASVSRYASNASREVKWS